jgi:hypothetical protein
LEIKTLEQVAHFALAASLSRATSARWAISSVEIGALRAGAGAETIANTTESGTLAFFRSAKAFGEVSNAHTLLRIFAATISGDKPAFNIWMTSPFVREVPVASTDCETATGGATRKTDRSNVRKSIGRARVRFMRGLDQIIDFQTPSPAEKNATSGVLRPNTRGAALLFSAH